MNASRTARERVREELTREITEIARSQLATEGAAGLSLRAVAREMGMVSSAIYRSGDYTGRWLAVCRAVRNWALAHPHEYALVYGSPVPGYQAPQQTIAPATRAATVYGKIISDAHRAGALDPPGICPPPPQSFGPDAAALRASVMAKVSDDVAARAVAGWTALFGMVSFELFGQFENVITDRDAFFEHSMRCQGRLTGLSP